MSFALDYAGAGDQEQRRVAAEADFPHFEGAGRLHQSALDCLRVPHTNAEDRSSNWVCGITKMNSVSGFRSVFNVEFADAIGGVMEVGGKRPGAVPMSDNLPKAVLDSADITFISQLILRERESRDLGRWDQMRDCFWPDSVVRISWFRGNGPDFVTGSIDM